MADNSNATSGGLLVILGIIVALGAVYFFYNYSGHSSAPGITVNLPAVTEQK